MELTNGSQLYHLFLSCGLGFLLGLYYDVFRVFRLVMRSGARTIFFQDLFFFSSSAVATFLFALTVTGGQLRFYLFLGSLIGFAAYYFTIGRVVVRFAGGVAACVIRFWKWFWSTLFIPFRLLGRFVSIPIRALAAFLQKISGKITSFLKKALKHTVSLLYNHKKRGDKKKYRDEADTEGNS